MSDHIETPIRSISQSEFSSRLARLKAGRKLREKVSRSDQGNWQIVTQNRDPIAILEESNVGRIAKLVPIRYGRMLKSPFSFLRGAAALMAYDLASTPTTDISVQVCGDCHLLNFGLFATPERRLIFDLNDFDETLPGPWEWDIKRLVTSFVVAARDNNLSDQEAAAIAQECVGHYRKRLLQYSHMSPLDVWYERLDAETIIEMAPDVESKKLRQKMADKARRQVIEHHFPKITTQVDGRVRIQDQPPLIFHIEHENWDQLVKEGLEHYRESLSDELRVLLDRYILEDTAMKVVGIGSVGTRCYIGLFMSEDDDPLILQLKEARRSVLEPYLKQSQYQNQGQRVVMGQRLMQSSSDIFLGWLRGLDSCDFYVRQLRDMKLSLAVDKLNGVQLKRYAEFCGWTLARAHAKSGDAATISGYLGKSDKFDQGMGKFALAYADQNNRDYVALLQAVKTGRVVAHVDNPI